MSVTTSVVTYKQQNAAAAAAAADDDDDDAAAADDDDDVYPGVTTYRLDIKDISTYLLHIVQIWFDCLSVLSAQYPK